MLLKENYKIRNPTSEDYQIEHSSYSFGLLQVLSTVLKGKRMRLWDLIDPNLGEIREKLESIWDNFGFFVFPILH